MRKHFQDAPEFPKLRISVTQDLEQHTLTQKPNVFSTYSSHDADATFIHETIYIADPKMYDIPLDL